MKTKTELTNEMVAEALGWKRARNSWLSPEAQFWSETPNFLNDLNVCFKYVWPKMIILCKKNSGYPNTEWGGSVQAGNILFEAFMTTNPATALCKAFMEMKGGE